MENLLEAWREFLRGKKKRRDVAEFSLRLLENIVVLHKELGDKSYRHGPYTAFKINDPKPRDIHKASVRDRLLHHAVYRILCPYFDRKFSYDSHSCRIGKGTFRAMRRFRDFARKVSNNNTRTAWVMKCDIKKFFANINHQVLNKILVKHLADVDVLWLLDQVIDSFCTEEKPGVGLPLGNLTSQLLVNVHMNELDQFVKRGLKIHYYVRYADDFVILHHSKKYLESLVSRIADFLEKNLKLSLHPQKFFIKTLASGVDFLGWIHFPNHKILRTSTKRRMFRRLRTHPTDGSIASYLGLLGHGNTHKLKQQVEKEFGAT